MPFCRQCGTENPEHSRFCGHCGGALETGIPQPPDARPPYSQPPRGQIPYGQPPSGPSGPDMTTTILLAVFSMVCCGCLPLGVVSLIYAIMASSRSAQGDMPGAVSMQKQAQTWAYVSIGLGVLAGALWFVFALAGLGSRLN